MPQLWAGPECTVNRVGGHYVDQLRLNGHDHRPADLDLLAALGVAAVRYPVLWERVAPDHAAPDWRWSDARLARLRELGIRPIVGLVHHGSGPRHTDLLDDGFAAALGDYAGRVATRYPWVEDWTPVNEPLTTARFSALYGHWYPHARDEGSFWRALLNQVEGIVAAMRAVRRVNPAARLIQTDDLGRTYATPAMADQAAFDNERRWAGWDLLFGRVTPHHPLWQRIADHGLGEALRRIADAPCPPDIVGVNHYLTSDRFLDERIERYPAATHGGNGRVRYADTEAVRVLEPAPQGLDGALREAWARYGVPIAVTEVHNGCSREEQLRWAAEAWDNTVALRADGVDIVAVTAWSLFGSHGWDTLLTGSGRYEPGLYDVANGTPRPTALAGLWRGLPQQAPRHPVATQPGWWRRPGRLIHPPHGTPEAAPIARPSAVRPLLICGASGTLGQAFARACTARGIDHVLTGRDRLDLQRADDVAAVLDGVRPWGVVNATGWVRVDDAEDEAAACHRINATGAIALAEACAARGIPSLGFSSDLVFDGVTGRPYVETDAPNGLGVYGRSKHAMERGCAALPRALVVRTAAFFSPHDPYNFAFAVLDALGAGRPFAAAEDHIVSPTYVPALVDAALDLLIDGAEGIWHLSGDEPLSWAAFARRVALAAGHDATGIAAVPGKALGWRAPRPGYAALASERGSGLEPLDASIAALVGNASLRRACAAQPGRVPQAAEMRA